VKDLFYAPDLRSDGYTLEGDQFRHAVKVLRKRVGDELMFTDGAGMLATVVLTEVGKRGARFEVRDSRVVERRPYSITVGVAPTKNTKRIEWALEKMVEIGLERIVPILCEHSERTVLKTDRLNAIAVSAMKQSQQAYLTDVADLTSLADHVRREADRDTLRYIGYQDENSSGITDNYTAGQDVSVLIGPEGDFSPEEIELARQAGFVPVLLGSNRLRTETAAVMAVAVIHTLNM
jgi:16S rRNA (uracil1498-N3)-methyltransferase